MRRNSSTCKRPIVITQFISTLEGFFGLDHAHRLIAVLSFWSYWRIETSHLLICRACSSSATLKGVHGSRLSKRRPWNLGISIAICLIACCHAGYRESFSGSDVFFVKSASERLMRKTSSFSGTGPSTSSITWKRWLLWKWILPSSKKKELYEQNLRKTSMRRQTGLLL